ncbi:MAG: hypothetical protein QF726_06500 [Alphaproteobacteria bacterium]|jgi:hypothetical protein|nr:hypothetical protein [Alphaproteobacteria bacterium]HJM61101.1 hypothetical protein [Alphaproteobacteria bacterium]
MKSYKQHSDKTYGNHGERAQGVNLAEPGCANRNKRTGGVASVLFLELDGASVIAPEAEARRAVIDLATGDVDRDSIAR